MGLCLVLGTKLWTSMVVIVVFHNWGVYSVNIILARQSYYNGPVMTPIYLAPEVKK